MKKIVVAFDSFVWLLSGCMDDKDNVLTQNFDLVKSINEDDNRPLDILMQSSVAKENLRRTINKIFYGGNYKSKLSQM